MITAVSVLAALLCCALAVAALADRHIQLLGHLVRSVAGAVAWMVRLASAGRVHVGWEVTRRRSRIRHWVRTRQMKEADMASGTWDTDKRSDN